MEPIVAVWNNIEFRVGDRVRLIDRPHIGAFTPSETGHPVQIAAGPDQVGTVIGGEKPFKSQTDYEISIEIEYGIITPYERDVTRPNEVVVVRWDAQEWTEYHGENRVKLPAFEAEIHAGYVEKISLVRVTRTENQD